ncbi:MAG: MotA/TolQ/ExbB proton channel family protein [Rhodobacteraceae bacterium]|nr:MotA/TolQ/ExbB proton channel family protein [Paracoccaceae bacterium]
MPQTNILAQVINEAIALIDAGGPVVALIACLSMIAGALVLTKAVQFWKEGVGRSGRAQKAVNLWRAGKKQDAMGLIQAPRTASEECVCAAMNLSTRGTLTRDQIEDEISRRAVARLHQQQWGLKALDAIGQVAPLLGLFGTVLGMIEAFQNLQSAGNSVDPSMLAGGIWVALLTTAAGLAVAMPVSLLLTFFESRIDHERVAIETLSAGVLLAFAQDKADIETAHLVSQNEDPSPAARVANAH